eukprot:GEMP01000361.1.p1 GENE.GEMP01000361.1~~GEMP01000361.1.p1  ORF type:complete len:978 (+),score=267.64 GEMP01000361.1:624-3557(+)
MTSSDMQMRNDGTYQVPAGYQQQPSGYRTHRHDIPELGYWKADDDGPMVNTPMSPLSDDYIYEEALESENEPANYCADTFRDMQALSEAEIRSQLSTPNMRRMMGAPSLDPRYLSNRMMPSQMIYQTPYLYYSTDEESLWRARPVEMMGPQPAMRMEQLQQNMPKGRFDPSLGFFNPAGREMMPEAVMRPLMGDPQNMFGVHGEREKKKPSEASSSRRREPLPKTTVDMSHMSVFRNPIGTEDYVDQKGNPVFMSNPNSPMRSNAGPYGDPAALGVDGLLHDKWYTPPSSAADAWYTQQQRAVKHDPRLWYSKNDGSPNGHMSLDLGAYSGVQRGGASEKGGTGAQSRSRMKRNMALGGLSLHDASAMQAQHLRAAHQQQVNWSHGPSSGGDRRLPQQRATGDKIKENGVMDPAAFNALGFIATDGIARRRDMAARGGEDARADAWHRGQLHGKFTDSPKMEEKRAYLPRHQDKVEKGKMRAKADESGDSTRHTSKSVRDTGVDWYQASVNALTNNGQKISMEEMFAGKKYLKHIGELGHCQVSCRLLQEKLEMSDDRLFNEFLTSLLETSATHDTCSQFVELMVDPFGNYLCQKIIDKCNTYQLELLQLTMTPHVLRICLSPHGSRAMQKYVESAVHRLPKQSLQDFCNGFKKDVSALVCNQVGNHVITRFLKLLPPKYRAFIFTAVANSVRQVATNRYGCCVLQRSMDICDASQKHMLCVEICNNALHLIQDPYGNYAIQYVISQMQVDGEPNNENSMYCGMVCDQIIDHIGMLATQKFSSNVIERCLERAPPGKLHRMLEEIGKPATLSMLVKDSFGNYVVQMALNVARDAQLESLLVNLQPLLSTVEGPYLQKRVRRKLIKKYPLFAAKLKESKNPPSTRVTESSTSSFPTDVPDAAQTGDPPTQCTGSDSLVHGDDQTFGESEQYSPNVEGEQPFGSNPDEEQQLDAKSSTSEELSGAAPMFVQLNSSPQGE